MTRLRRLPDTPLSWTPSNLKLSWAPDGLDSVTGFRTLGFLKSPLVPRAADTLASLRVCLRVWLGWSMDRRPSRRHCLKRRVPDGPKMHLPGHWAYVS